MKNKTRNASAERNSIAHGGARIGPAAYRAWRASARGRITEEIEQRLLLGLLGKVAGRAVLDAGCGDGTFALELARLGATVTGADADAAMIAAARTAATAAGLPARFEVGEIESLPFPDRGFDAVVAVTVLCLVPDASRAVAEMARVLRPGGVLVVGELGRRSLWAGWRRLKGLFGAELWRHSRFFAPADLRALAHAAGLRVERIAGAVYYPPADWAARLIGPWDGRLSALGALGAAFLAMKAVKDQEAGDD